MIAEPPKDLAAFSLAGAEQKVPKAGSTSLENAGGDLLIRVNCRNIGGRAQTDQGQALVEFALLLPVLAFFIFLALQFAIILSAYLSVVQLARHSARYVAVHSEMYDNEIVAQAVQPSTPSNLRFNNLVLISIDPGVCDSGNSSTDPCDDRVEGTPVTITLRYDAQDNIFLPTTFFGFQIPTTLPDLSATMVVE